MSRVSLILSIGLGLMIVGILGQAQTPASRPDYDVNFIGQPLADPVMQHSKETYVLFGCAYCHGVNLVARGEAADLMHSTLVGTDEGANLIGPLLRAGIPQTAKLSPMPQFSDLSNAQIEDIARYIHYARRQGRYKELIESKELQNGNAVAGSAYVDTNCRTCHRGDADLSQVAHKYQGAALTARVLYPEFVDAAPSWTLDQKNDSKLAEARRRHSHLLENYTVVDVANLLAYLAGAK